ncbi:DUF1737 domain-containing protein [Pseudomonas alabamensis]|uniref:DUF1737 domain-containing protein n=1 Tax=Pseudomonas alabamensis TaxID=3064349 RepID=UPI003F6543BD
MSFSPPNDLPTYRLITGKDDESFCRRVSEQLALGYKLHGSASVTYDSERKSVIAAQAVIWPTTSHVLANKR